jgi:ribosome biogenesis GTPase
MATFTSSSTGEGVAELRALLDGELTAVMLGHSGVGKSSLANRLVGRDVLATGAVRERDGKGRQTTTARCIIPLPGSASALIDTPGIRELGVSLHFSLKDVFVEIEELAASCRFPDCSHRHDAGCAVRQAVDEQAISAERYHRYLKLARQREHERRRGEPAIRDKSTEYARLARQYREARGR